MLVFNHYNKFLSLPDYSMIQPSAFLALSKEEKLLFYGEYCMQDIFDFNVKAMCYVTSVFYTALNLVVGHFLCQDISQVKS